MPAPPAETLAAYWDAALAEEIGIRVPCTKPEEFRKDLYALRRSQPNPAWDALMLFIPNLPDDRKEVWIVKKATELPE